MSFSGRPETSARKSSNSTNQVLTPQTSNSNDSFKDGPYVPHVFDFIILAGDAERIIKSSISPLYLQSQAVDTSTVIGNGATFTASYRAIPEVEEVEYEAPSMDGLRVTIKRSPEKRPKHAVYKTARVAFSSQGEPLPEYRRAMSAAMMEIYALVHKPLLEHPNIVNYLALAWGSNPFEPTHKLPVAVVEYAEHGTLADLQEKVNLSSELRRSLCLDAALGLEVLHRCGLVHGDVKAENVLIFPHQERQYTAKVADFGFSVVEAAANAVFGVGGTRPWKAPETVSPVPKAQLKSTDVYSFGLLVWRVATNGETPFKYIVSPELDGDTLAAEIARMKEADEVKSNAMIDTWYFKYITRSSGMDATEATSLPELQEELMKSMSNPSAVVGDAGVFDHVIAQLSSAFAMLGMSTSPLGRLVLTKARSDAFYGVIDAIVEKSLGRDPTSRNLAEIISILNRNEGRKIDFPEGDILLRRSFDHHLLSWQRMRDLDLSVQGFVFKAFRSRSQEDAETSMINLPQTFLLASFHINGYGTERNYSEAIRLIRLAAKWGHESAQAYGYRICKALDKDFEPDEEMVSNLIVTAEKGSRTALEDLRGVEPQKCPFIEQKLQEVMAGVGANFFFDTEMLNMQCGLRHWAWMDMLKDKKSVGEKLDGIKNKQGYKVNKRGDKIAHIAASCGRREALEALLDIYGVDVNHLNDQGETPLLSACRAGQVEVVQLLLDKGADASIVTPFKESPLHWLISFKGEDVRIIGKSLITKGGDIRLLTTKDISYSVFPSGIDTDHQQCETPLGWAVHHNRPDIVKFLLDASRDPSICIIKPPGRPTNALFWAAHYHHLECLKLMLEAMTEAKFGFTYGPLIQTAAYSADDYSMILRHGPEYRIRLEATFNYLLEMSKNVTFSTGIGEFGDTLLYFAVSRANEAVVEYLLCPSTWRLLGIEESMNEWIARGATSAISRAFFSPSKSGDYQGSDNALKITYMPGTKSVTGAFIPEHVNQSCGSENSTPILEAVRWNRKPTFDLLLSHGADIAATCLNPFTRRQDWTALHVFAHAGHDTNISLVDSIISAGLTVDPPSGSESKPLHITETPLSVAIQNNAFNLATALLNHGADINALSTSSGLITTSYPTTILGHIVASTAQHSHPRIRFLLFSDLAKKSAFFIVQPSVGTTALHLAASAYRGLCHSAPPNAPLRRRDFDWNTNRSIMYELLQKFDGQDQLDAKDNLGRTALHVAIEVGNKGCVRQLVGYGARLEIADGKGEAPVMLGRRLRDSGGGEGSREEMEDIVRVLER